MCIALLMLVAASSSFAGTVYNMNLSIGTGTVTGPVTTDGNTGTLTAADFTNWDLTIKDGATSATLLGPGFGTAANSIDQMNGSSVSATPGNITFNFSGSAAANAYLFFESSSGPVDFVCFGPGGGGSFHDVCASGQNGNVEAFEINGGDNQSILLSGTQPIATICSAELTRRVWPAPSATNSKSRGTNAGAVTRTQAASATSSPERPSLSVLAHQTISSSIRLA